MTLHTLSHLLVQHAMRRQRIDLSQRDPLAAGIGALVKYKVSALLTTDEDHRPMGVVSKTDLMGAYYAGLPTAAPLADIMSSPLLFCQPQETLEAALERMRTHRIYRLFVREDPRAEIVGTLAYPDIVGLLYRFCHTCEYSKYERLRRKAGDDPIVRYRVKEVMTPSVQSLGQNETLNRVMEDLSAYRFGALLITGRDLRPSGVISKTDLILAFRHGIDPQGPAESIMTSPVRTCNEDHLLEDAIRTMILSDVHRLFVHRAIPDHIVGVLSLTDAARIRSGSCHACVSSRIKVEESEG
jgi:CBS domain-containing protein